MLHEGNRFGVSVLAQGQTALSDFFARRAGAEGVEPEFFVMRETPLVEGALAHFVARVVRSYWGGDHSLFLGHVEYARYGKGEPLLFHGGRYERMVGEPELLGAASSGAARPDPRGAAPSWSVRGRREDHGDRRAGRVAVARLGERSSSSGPAGG